MSEPVRFALHQNGIEVASVEGGDRARALREIMHYAMIYGQDGPVQIHGIKPEDWASLTEGTDHQRRVDGAGNIVKAIHGPALSRLAGKGERG